jgi:hypothetical protein
VVILQDVVELIYMYLAASLKVELEMESASGFEMLQTFDNKAAITTRRTTEVWNGNGMKSVPISRCNDFVSIYIYANTRYYASILIKFNNPPKTPRSNPVIYSFAMPALRLSYLLYGYSRQFWLFSICLASYPPSPWTVMLIRLSPLEPGWSPELSHHMAPPRPVFLM